MCFSPNAVTFFAWEMQQPEKSCQIWRPKSVFNSTFYKFIKMILTWKFLHRLWVRENGQMDNHEKYENITW